MGFRVSKPLYHKTPVPPNFSEKTPVPPTKTPGPHFRRFLPQKTPKKFSPLRGDFNQKYYLKFSLLHGDFTLEARKISFIIFGISTNFDVLFSGHDSKTIPKTAKKHRVYKNVFQNPCTMDLLLKKH